ncbi:MAG: ERF family protein [Bellilinea sp.]
MNKSNMIKELATALSKAQSELAAAPFNAVNPFLKNKYADLGSIIETSRPILAKYGLAVSQLTVTEDDKVGITTILMHQSGEWLESTASLATGEERGKSSAQVAGSIITYLRRYSLASILGMYADEDTDGNHQAVKPAAKPESPAQPTPSGNGHNQEAEAAPATGLYVVPKGENPPNALVSAGICDSVPAASALLSKHVPQAIRGDAQKVVDWGYRYRSYRDADKSVEEAAKLASA